ncbi:hypothetical protein DPV78_012130 [Talaromyces pinophilus]|nr:hypothetical protein DPV78_012130 [Talaromyces pinophilus]
MNAPGTFSENSRVSGVPQRVMHCKYPGLWDSAPSLSVAPFSFPMPGVQCQTCKQAGRETWVIPGKPCHVCGTFCGLLADADESESE